MAKIIGYNRKWPLICLLLTLVIGLGIFLVPTHTLAANTFITIMEEPDELSYDSILKFVVTTDYDNIVAFAVSHSSAYYGNAGIYDDLYPEFAVPPDGWYATTIDYDEDNGYWKEYETDRQIDWLGTDSESWLPDHDTAWLFTCYDEISGYGEALWSEEGGGTTGGFYGITAMPMSDFAAYNLPEGETSTVLFGETTQVPIPSAVWLLGAGLVGIVGIRRKFKN